MTGAAKWRDADGDDRELLKGWYCTTPAPRLPNGRSLPHPKEWEREVQAYVKRHFPPGRREDFYRLGLDEDGRVVAVAIACPFQEPSTMPVFKIIVLGVSVDVRGSGGQVADEALQDLLEQMAQRVSQDGGTEFTVFGLVAHDNVPSQRMCERAGFVPSEDVDDDYRRWSLVVEI